MIEWGQKLVIGKKIFLDDITTTFIHSFIYIHKHTRKHAVTITVTPSAPIRPDLNAFHICSAMFQPPPPTKSLSLFLPFPRSLSPSSATLPLSKHPRG